MNKELAVLIHRPEIMGMLGAGVLLVLAGIFTVLRRPKRKTSQEFKDDLEAAKEDRDKLIQQLDKVMLGLKTDQSAAFRDEAFQMVLTIHNQTDLDLSPVMMIYWSRSQAWYFNDPRMGRGRIEFDLREFAKKTPPGRPTPTPSAPGCSIPPGPGTEFG